MSVRNTFLPKLRDLRDFTIFLDRDGVINEPIVDDYAKNPSDLIFCEGALEAIKVLQAHCQHVILVTNQQGVDKGAMTEQDLENVHLKFYNALKKVGASYADLALYAPYLKEQNHVWRKPKNGMLMYAKESILTIDWAKSIMVGDSPSDMQLADTLGLLKVKISNPQFDFHNQDFEFDSLDSFVRFLSN
jgi:histidinol-phosphate phosphatase family protein